MKSRETLIRLRRFDVDEHRQKVTDIETMIADFQQMATDLDRQIEVEQEKAGVSDVNHYAYPTFAKAAVERRQNLVASIGELETKLEVARGELAEAFEELKKVELMQERDAEQGRVYAKAAEQADLDEIGRMSDMGLAGERH
ncbi:MAG: flagellar export protein FliJ [Hyphomicrobiales bacterium]|nr:flagellar export protein FliJ [Hyphomicrobiales bacterium]